MSAMSHSQDREEAVHEREFVQRRLDEIDGSLMATIEEDARLQSGVPESGRTDELDFIQMTGLTRSAVKTASAPRVAPPDDLDPAQPVSFYEKGVVDVDHAIAPLGAEAPDLPKPAPAPHTAVPPAENPAARPPVIPPARSVDAFRELVADLTRDMEGKPAGHIADAPSIAETPDIQETQQSTVLEAPEPPPPHAKQEQPAAPRIQDVFIEEAPAAAEQNAVEDMPPPDMPVPSKMAAQAAPELDDALPAIQDDAGSEDIAPVVEEPPAASGTAAAEEPMRRLVSDTTQRLAEAEQLLNELEEQPREPQEEDSVHAPAPRRSDSLRQALPIDSDQSSGLDAPAALNGGDDEERETRFEYDYSAAPTKPARSRRHTYSQRKLLRKFLFAAVILIAVAAGFMTFRSVLRPAMLSSEDLMRSARSAVQDGRYYEASQTFLQVTRRHPDQLLGAEAQFEAGVALQLSASGSGDAARKRREEALSVMIAFVRDHPADIKRPRAECLIGVLHFELGHYQEVVNILREPARQVDDPNAVLPILRTLAAAHRMMGEYDQAESAYLQAAVLPRNYSADADYYDLGELSRERARLAETPADRQRFLQAALTYWDKAVRIPGGDPSKRTEIQKQIDRIRADIAAEGVTLPAPESAAPPAPVANTELGGQPDNDAWEPDPNDEAQHLEEALGS